MGTGEPSDSAIAPPGTGTVVFGSVEIDPSAGQAMGLEEAIAFAVGAAADVLDD